MDETVNFNPVNTHSNNLIKMQSNVKDGRRQKRKHVSKAPMCSPLATRPNWARKAKQDVTLSHVPAGLLQGRASIGGLEGSIGVEWSGDIVLRIFPGSM